MPAREELRYLNFHAPGMRFADYLRAVRDGRSFSYDQHDPPADGGRSPADAWIGPPPLQAETISLAVGDGAAADYAFELDDGRLLEISRLALGLEQLPRLGVRLVLRLGDLGPVQVEPLDRVTRIARDERLREPLVVGRDTYQGAHGVEVAGDRGLVGGHVLVPARALGDVGRR